MWMRSCGCCGRLERRSPIREDAENDSANLVASFRNQMYDYGMVGGPQLTEEVTGHAMLNRRDAMIRLGQLGLGALSLPTLLRGQALANSTGAKRGTADSCIFIFLWGGPPQQDLWDMKPDAPQGIRSQFQPINTVVPGISICDQMPLFARHTDKTTIVRSLSHGSNNHEPSVYHMLTGRTNPTLVVPRNARNRRDFPNYGSVISYFQPPSAMPAHVTVPRPIGHDGVTYSGTHAGFLGPRFDPLEKVAAVGSRETAVHPTTPLPDLPATRLQ